MDIVENNIKQNLSVLYNSPHIKLGIASYLIRTLVRRIHEPNELVYLDWSDLDWYQNNGEHKNIWDLILKQPCVEFDDIKNYNVIRSYTYNNWNSITDFDVPKSISIKTRQMTKKIIDKDFVLNDEMQTNVELLYEHNLKGKKCLAVHRRGMPGFKILADDYVNICSLNIIKSENYECAFVCSDNLASKMDTINFLKANGVETFAVDSIISEVATFEPLPHDADSIHLPYDRNLLVKGIATEAYLMSKCDGIIRTANSGISRWVLYMNPDIQHYNLQPDIL